MEIKENTGIMVCVTGQRSCERLIMHGAQRSETCAAEEARPPLYVVHCVQTGQNIMNTPYEADAMEYLFTCAQVVGAELTVLRADSVEDALVDFAHENGIGVIIMGSPADGSPMGRLAARLGERLPEIEFDILQ